MQKKMRSPVYLLPFLFCLSLFTVTAGCGPETKYVGTYIAEAKDSHPPSEATLELNETGAGVWKVGNDEVAFSWHVKDNEVRLYAKNGGIIVGSLGDRTIRVTLPGSEELLFRKIK